MKQPTTVKEKSIATLYEAALALREKVIPGVDNCVDIPSIYDIEEWDISNNQTMTAVNESVYNPVIEELDVKLPATKKAQDVLLEDHVPSSRLSPPTATNRFGIGEQLPVSQDVNTIHVFNDNHKSTLRENKKEEHPKVMEVSLSNQQTDTEMESELVSKTTTEIVNLDHSHHPQPLRKHAFHCFQFSFITKLATAPNSY